MTPALRHNSKTTIIDGLNNLASEFDLKVTSPKISGVFMFMSNYKPISQFRQHYSCSIDGQLKFLKIKKMLNGLQLVKQLK